MNATTRLRKVTAELHAIREQAETLAERAKKLEATLASMPAPRAKGSREVTTQAAAAVKTSAPAIKVGDETTTEILVEAVRQAITGRARTLQELIEVTGARRNRISGVLVRLQVANPGIVKNLGTNARAIWYIEPARPSGRYSRRDR